MKCLLANPWLINSRLKVDFCGFGEKKVDPGVTDTSWRLEVLIGSSRSGKDICKLQPAAQLLCAFRKEDFSISSIQ